MSPERPDQSRYWMLTGFLLAILFAQWLALPALAQGKENHAQIWGPLFKDQVTRCWRKHVRRDAAAKMEVAFRISLRRDGTFAEPPSLEPDKPATSGYAAEYQKSALRALNECQPYKLPIEYYDEWKYFVPVFVEPVESKSVEKKPKALDDPFKMRSPSICRGC